MDPQINYTLQYWQLYQAIYDGLVAFKKGQGTEGFKVVADLAEEVPAPQDDGKTYVFKLRKGIKFSNGDPVTVKDVVASFQRIFKISGPDGRHILQRHCRRGRLYQDASELHARWRRGGR